MAVAKQGMVRYRFIWTASPGSTMGADCRRRADAFSPELLARMSNLTQELISWMQTNRPWTDRTEDAKNNLDAFANETGKGNVTLVARHGVPYGGFLETGTSKMAAFPVIGPGLQAHYAPARKIMDELAGSG